MIVGLFMVFGYYLASTFKVLTLFGAGVLCQVFSDDHLLP